ncbi:hypothetical protein [Roseovarius indicus]|uniref:Uncharacterized protein n=1 Tax=Roseovarius indicus TaxID=540747 RepID=A0A0T5P3C3_9RHOB|nr:hypothetical protein [Roseovarius indicus]KRS15659.1 hypothetical protein XM52_22740 [Roseovarius indicus]QEW27830.1 hypothetical protein RIdsm_03650 [Roseovarius indicus]SFE79699.1 hypothetical protein SAMN04488031_12238 [Roseovarius indicus]
MAVVEGKSNLIHDYLDSTSEPPSPAAQQGEYRALTGTVANASSDSSGSMYHLADVPSDAIVHEDTFFDVENWGFAQIVIGTREDTDALVDQTLATENTVTPFAVGDANHGKTWWEALGMSEDPGGEIGIYIHAEAGATGAGSMPFRIVSLDSR